MKIPAATQALIAAELDAVQRNLRYDLKPGRRVAIYDSFGPSFAPADYIERIGCIQAGKRILTTADRVRARLAILTGWHVLPIWQHTLTAAGLLSAEGTVQEVRYLLGGLVENHIISEKRTALLSLLNTSSFNGEQVWAGLASLTAQEVNSSIWSLAELQATMLELLIAALPAATRKHPLLVAQQRYPPLPAWRKSVLAHVLNHDLPQHLLHLAGAVLDESASLQRVFEESSEVHEILGNYLGYDEDELPGHAYAVAGAAYEALHQSLGLGPFNGLQIDETTTDEDSPGAAAAAALKAYAGIFDGGILMAFVPQKRREFWQWWLAEAIPLAWELERGSSLQPAATVPFVATVQATVVKVATVYFDENGIAYFDDDLANDLWDDEDMLDDDWDS